MLLSCVQVGLDMEYSVTGSDRLIYSRTFIHMKIVFLYRKSFIIIMNTLSKIKTRCCTFLKKRMLVVNKKFLTFVKFVHPDYYFSPQGLQFGKTILCL